MVRGEIWWANLPAPSGSEPGFRRPVLIIQSDTFNKSKINTIICVVITSNLKLANAPGNVFLSKSDSNLTKESVINVSQVIALDKSFLTECVGTINKMLVKKVENGLKLVLNL
ncbi:MAG: type II toxin-antitoxin system PemK/MazF family toxin [bacterium]